MSLLKDKVCVVTGAARGIGLEIATLYAQNGAVEVYACDLNVGSLVDVQKTYPNLTPFALDVTKPESLANLVTTLKTKNQGLDVLVNNAGVTADAMITEMTEQQWDFVNNVNLKGVFLTTQALIPLMYEAKKGSVINMASIVGTDGNIGQSNYGATKGGVIAMSKGWAKEFSLKGASIRVNCLAPGFVRTPMTEKMPQNVIDYVVSRTLLKRMAEPNDIAQGALFLASDNAAFITGQVLKIDGGLVL